MIFFARYEASNLGCREISTEHLLLGMLRESPGLLVPWLRSRSIADSIRKQIEAKRAAGESIPPSVDLPLSRQSKRVLAYSAEEGERLKHKNIGPEHLLIGLLREGTCLAGDLLKQHGLTVEQIRKDLQSPEPEKLRASRHLGATITENCRDLTAAAGEGKFHPLIGRLRELENIIQVLGRRSGNSALLIGEPGVGKTAIVEGLAQRIADGAVPQFLAGRRILALDPEFMQAAENRQHLEEKFAGLIQEIVDQSNVILSIDGLFEPSVSRSFAAVLGGLMAAVSTGRIQCIATGTTAGYRDAVQKYPGLEHHLRVVTIEAPSEKEAVQILLGIKEQYETYHAVTYDDAAIQTAVRASIQFMPNRQLPEKAIDLIDEAGARVKLRDENEPHEIVELRKRMHAITKQFVIAIAKHEFEKARSYEQAEREEREKLNVLREKYKQDDLSPKAVTPQDIEELVAERAGLAVDVVRRRLEKK